MRTYRVRIGRWWRDIKALNIRDAILFGAEQFHDEVPDYPDISDVEMRIKRIQG